MAGNHLTAVSGGKLPWLDEALREALKCCANGDTAGMLEISYTRIPQGGPGIECLDTTHGGVRRCHIRRIQIVVELPEDTALSGEEGMPLAVAFYAG